MKMSCFTNAVHCGSMAATFSDHVSVIKFAVYSYFSLCPLFTTVVKRVKQAPSTGILDG